MTDWPHAPPHRLFEAGTYMVTCGIYKKEQHLAQADRLDFMLQTLFDCASESGWQLQAWAVLSNHYHFIAASPADPSSLRKIISTCHSLTAQKINREDNEPGRKVWHQYYDSRITYHRSYLARLKYVHYNPAKHGVVTNAADYKWCSAAWFERESQAVFRKTVQSFKIDTINVFDAFDPISPIGQKRRQAAALHTR